MSVKSVAYAALVSCLLAVPLAAPFTSSATADDRADVFGFAALFGGGFSGVTAGTSPIPRQVVAFDPKYKAGSVVVNTSTRRLYYITQPGQAIQYGIGVGREGFQWSGVKVVSAKKEWPSWVPPAQMLKRRPDLPRYMPGGIDNPLGARAMYLGSSLYRIHGSNEPETIGQAVSSGCIRMTNDDVVDLYNRVKVGATVYVMR